MHQFPSAPSKVESGGTFQELLSLLIDHVPRSKYMRSIGAGIADYKPQRVDAIKHLHGQDNKPDQIVYIEAAR